MSPLPMCPVCYKNKHKSEVKIYQDTSYQNKHAIFKRLEAKQPHSLWNLLASQSWIYRSFFSSAKQRDGIRTFQISLLYKFHGIDRLSPVIYRCVNYTYIPVEVVPWHNTENKPTTHSFCSSKSRRVANKNQSLPYSNFLRQIMAKSTNTIVHPQKFRVSDPFPHVHEGAVHKAEHDGWRMSGNKEREITSANIFAKEMVHDLSRRKL